MSSYPADFLQLWVDSYWIGTSEDLTVYYLSGFLLAPSLAMDNVYTRGPLLDAYLMLDRPDLFRSRGG